MQAAEQIMQKMQAIHAEREEQYKARDAEFRQRNDELKKALLQLDKKMKDIQISREQLNEEQQRIDGLNAKYQLREGQLSAKEDELRVLQEQINQDRIAMEEDISTLKLKAQMESEKVTTLRIEAERIKDRLEYDLSLKESGIEIEINALGQSDDMISIEEHQKEVDSLNGQIQNLVNEKAELLKKMISQQITSPQENERPTEEIAVVEENYTEQLKQEKMEPVAGTENKEDITPMVIYNYLSSNDEYSDVEKRHGVDGEIVTAKKNGLDYYFLFTDIPRFEILKERKYDRALKKAFTELNQLYPETKFDYEDGKAIASTYFMKDLPLYNLVEAVDQVSNAFKPKE
ncbi:chromosome segregation ATPase [Aequitasia blattaphilus]|uniref:Uncharacterized protein n=1 Tax=Aequitasia blattaphilus TaxID=2949332 RepID=A0ABT1EAT8_9FIRM|nr:hypothetical protein [Aequitasia blattaphilus]MCP1101976.1 hypothetical protein [Aequitasia blattaphilus]MCR8614616.1 hypothetical protein [Aequitasia blattaphilus]